MCSWSAKICLAPPQYPSYWVSLDDLYASLQPIDRATGQPRGYSVLRSASSEVDMASSSGLLSLNFNKQSWPVFLKQLRSISPGNANNVLDEILSILRLNNTIPLQERSNSSEDVQAAKDQQQLDPVPTKLVSDAYNHEIRQLVSTLRMTSIWQSVAGAIHDKPLPKSLSTSVPTTLHYTLFLTALFTSPSAPLNIQHFGKEIIKADDAFADNGGVPREIRFLQEQMASLEKCCSSEAFCACEGNGLSPVISAP